MPFAGVACRVALVPMFGVSQVHIQFRFQTTFDHGFSQFFEQPTFSQQVLGIFIVFEQFINQFASDGHLFLLLAKGISRLSRSCPFLRR